LDDVPPVGAEDARLVQVVLNLLINAAHAVRDAAPSGQHEIAVEAHLSGERVVVEVHDTGCGIAPHLLEKVKEPFFTTKAIGEGTGLGLSVCQSIVEGYGGSLTLESRPGRTVARVSLPVAGASSSPPAAGPASVLGSDDAVPGSNDAVPLAPERGVTLRNC